MGLNKELAKEELESRNIKISDFAKLLNIELAIGNPDSEMCLSTVSVNRPGLFLAGFDEYFANSRIQVFGNAEYYYLSKMSSHDKTLRFEKLCKNEVPCIIFSRNLEIPEELKNYSLLYNIPIFTSSKITSLIVNEIINFLNDFLADLTTINGELLDISGIGVLLTGESGLGKSETALDLITRGHKLIADDLVNVKKVKDKLYGSAPEQIKYYMEVRGIGIINVPKLYGVGSVLDSKSINLIIELKKFNPGIKLERLENKNHYQNILGIDIPKLEIPVSAGRNLANIVEVATNNFRLNKMGYNAIQEFMNKIF